MRQKKDRKRYKKETEKKLKRDKNDRNKCRKRDRQWEKKRSATREKRYVFAHWFFFLFFPSSFLLFLLHSSMALVLFFLFIFFYVFMYFIWIFVPYCILSLYWPILCTFFRFRCFLAVISRLFSSSSFFTYQGLISWGRNRRHTRAGATVTNQKIYYKGKYEK